MYFVQNVFECNLSSLHISLYIYIYIPFFHLHFRINSYAGGSSGKEPVGQYRGHKRCSLIPVLGRSQCLENLMDRGAWHFTGLQRVINDWSDLVRMYTCSLFYIISSCKTLTANFFLLLFFNWRIITLQNFVVFCQTSTWISHRYTYIPSCFEPPSHLSHPSTLVQSPCLSFLSHIAKSHWLSISHRVI